MHLKIPSEILTCEKRNNCKTEVTASATTCKNAAFGLNRGDDAHGHARDGDGDGAHHREVTMRKSS